jgi:hypothetical protein
MPAGLLTTVLIAAFFSTDTQGYYYTLIPLIGLQTMADSGLQALLLHFTSHERASLEMREDGALTGSPVAMQRMASIYRFGLSWFVTAAVLFGIVVTVIGWVLLSRNAAPIAWHWPLILTVLLASISLAWSPLIAMLEGCNQVSVVNRMRLLQAISGSLAAWTCIALNGGLWTLVAATLVQVLWEAWLLAVRFRSTWASLRAEVPGHFNWRVEIWPLQWKLLVQTTARHFAYTPLIPVVLEFHGALLAGQLGMTWTVLVNIQMAAFSWIRTHSPKYGILIAKRDFWALDSSFFRTVAVTSVALLVLLCTFVGLLALLPHLPFAFCQQLSGRFLDWNVAAVFAAALLPSHIIQCLSIYIRAHKQDPIMLVTCLGNLALGIAVFYLGRHYGPSTVAVAMLLVLGLITMPGVTWIWIRSRRLWHADNSQGLE